MSINKLITVVLLTACLAWILPACTSKENTPDPIVPDTAEHVATCRGAMLKLGTALKARLEAAVADSGLVGALAVCNIEAVPIAETISVEEGVLVGRTSLRIRNPRNAPDDWERGILAEFAARREKGEDLAELDAWTVAESAEGHHTFRYMKAIPTAPLCLSCHGTAVADQVATTINALYPEDAALGFAEGDIRGAFTVVKPLD
jgi:hypothetical protein